MPELLIQILLIATVAVAVKGFAVFAAKRGFSLLPIVLLLGVVLGPTVLNLFDQPLFTSGVGLSENTSGASLMRVLIELGLIQLVFATGARTDFVNLKKQIASFVLSGLAIFLIPAAFSIIVLKVFGASWALALATASVVSVVSVALTVRTNHSDGKQAAIAQGAALTTFILGAGSLFVAVGLRFEPTYGSGMTALGIVYVFLKAFLLVGSAFVVGRLYLRKLAGREPNAAGVQGVIGFVLLLAFFYGWAAWSVGQIAALPVVFVLGGLFARSNFVVKDKVISSLSKQDSWLICLFFLAFGLSADFYEIKSQAGVFVLLLVAAIGGKVCGAVLGVKITEQAPGAGLKLAARTFSIGEAGLILAIFAHSRAAITPGIFAAVVAVISLTTFAGPFLSGVGAKPGCESEEFEFSKKVEKFGATCHFSQGDVTMNATMKGPFYLLCLAALALAAGTNAARAQNETSVRKHEREGTEFRFRVKHDHLRKSCVGELVINNAGVEYLTAYEPHKRSWPFNEIRFLKLISATEIEILTYQQRRLVPSLNEPFKLGKDESFEFKLLEGEISPNLSEFLLERIKRPVMTTFVLQAAEKNPPLHVLPVRHRHRWGGCNGELRIYDDKVIYESFDDKKNSRLWRWSDIQSFGRSGRYRFEIVTFEPRFGGEKTFNFDLKEEMTDQIYDFFWKKFYKVTYYAPAPSKP